MVEVKRRFLLSQAQGVAEELVEWLSPACETNSATDPPGHFIAIAGSIRRGRPDPSDIEIVLVPAPSDWDGCSELNDRISLWFTERKLAYRLNKNGKPSYGSLNKYLTHVPTGIPIDIYTATAANWGRDLIIRTGPKEFNINLMKRAKKLAITFPASPLASIRLPYGSEESCPTEESVFKLLGWPYRPPELR